MGMPIQSQLRPEKFLLLAPIGGASVPFVGVVVNSPASPHGASMTSCSPCAPRPKCWLPRAGSLRGRCGLVYVRHPPCLKTQSTYVSGAVPRQERAILMCCCLVFLRKQGGQLVGFINVGNATRRVTALDRCSGKDGDRYCRTKKCTKKCQFPLSEKNLCSRF